MCHLIFRIFVVVLSICSSFSIVSSSFIVDACIDSQKHLFEKTPRLKDFQKINFLTLITCISNKFDTKMELMIGKHNTEKNALIDQRNTLISQHKTEKEALIKQHQNEIDSLVKEQKNNYTTLQNLYNDAKWTKCARQCIDEYEDDFGKHEEGLELESDKDNVKTSKLPPQKIFKQDTNSVKKIQDYYLRQEEKRRQKWIFYLENPPTNFVAKLAVDVKAKYNIPDFSTGIAVAYRILSSDIHLGISKGTHVPKRVHISSRNESNLAIQILLERFDLSDKQFSYEEVAP